VNSDVSLAIGAALALLAVVAGRAAGRFGVPALVVFVAIGMLAGSEGPGGVPFEDYDLAALVGNAAIAVILLAGGFGAKLDDLRRVAAPATVLATLGVLVTAGVAAVAAKALTPLPWAPCLLLGAVVSSTDAAAVFAVLRGRGLPPRLRTLLEAESGVNDPVAAFLVATLVDYAARGAPETGDALLAVARSFGLGLLCGYAVGRGAAAAVDRLRLDSAGLYPVFVLAAGVLAFAGTNLAGGNGFLAVYVAGALLGRPSLAYRAAIRRFLDGAASLMQVAVFLLLGLLSFPSRVFGHATDGLLVAAALMFVARPLAVWLCLKGLAVATKSARFSPAEIALVAWAGLRGAVPVIFALIPILRGLPGAETVFDLVFFVVLASALVQGSTVGLLARRLGLTSVETRAPVALEVASRRPVEAAMLDFAIDPGSACAGRTVASLDLPPAVAIAALWREGNLLPARGGTRLEPGDHVFVLAEPGAEAAVEAAFPARRVAASDD
jgi:cell volume regulation protein A